MRGRSWDAASDAFLTEHYPTHGAAWCAERLPDRTVISIQSRVQALGCRRSWSRSNVAIPTTPIIDDMIKAAYRGERRSGWRNALARRTSRSCTWVSNRAVELGLTVTRDVRPWTQPELDFANANPSVNATVLAKRMRRNGWLRTPTAIARKRIYGGLLSASRTVRDEDTDRFNAGQLALCFGVSTTAIIHWIRQGWLIAEASRSCECVASAPNAYVIHAADVAAFALAHPTRVSFTKLEPNKVWFLDLIARFPRAPSREDGTLQRRIRSVAAARPEIDDADLAALLGSDIATVRKARRRRPLAIVQSREAA